MGAALSCSVKDLARVSAHELIARVADGAYLRDLAKETGIDKRLLSGFLRQHPDYQAAKETCIEVQLDDAQLALTLAREPSDIARAREMFRAAAWRAEREFPHRWGQQTHVTVTHDDLGERLRRARERVIDAEPAQVIDSTSVALDRESIDPPAKG